MRERWLYAAEIWGYKMYEQLERVKIKKNACKDFYIICVTVQTPSDVVYGELGRYPLFMPATVRFVQYWLIPTDSLFK